MKAKQVYNKLVKGVKAVSPIVATLVLVLVAVGSATAYYGWQNGWQENIEGKANDANQLQESLTIAGSSTVYEFTAAAAPAFESANGVKIDFVSGGSGAGIANVGTGVCDIGSASRFVKDSELAQYPDLDRDGEKDYSKELITHTVAWDAVVVVVSEDFAATEITQAELLAIYKGEAGTVNQTYIVSNVDNATGSVNISLDNEADGIVTVGYTNATTGNWIETPSYTTDDASYVNITGDAIWENNTLSVLYNLSVDLDGDGTSDWEQLTTYDRSDDSGTAEVMRELIMGLDEDDLTGSDYEADEEVGSNQEMIAAITGATDVIGFTSWGMAQGVDGMTILKFQGPDDSSPVEATSETIIGGTYDGSRPINYITVGEPNGDVAAYLTFVTMAKNNQNFAEAAGYIPYYD